MTLLQTSPTPRAPPYAAASARGATKTYGNGDTQVVALDGVDVDFAAGQFTAIMGPSGSGKSTLMHCMAGLDRLTSGTVTIGDIDIAGASEKQLTLLRRDRIGFIFQAFNLVPTLTAIENITLPDGPRRAQARPGVARPRRRHGRPAHRLRHRPSELSGGQQQRVAVARALASRPQIIFADEPTGNLDSTHRRRDPRVHAARRARARPDHRHGHPRPGRRQLLRPRASSSPTVASPTSWPIRPPTPCSTTCVDSATEPDPPLTTHAPIGHRPCFDSPSRTFWRTRFASPSPPSA